MVTHSSILAWRVPVDRRACWATARGVAKSQTRLKQLRTRAQAASRCDPEGAVWMEFWDILLK